MLLSYKNKMILNFIKKHLTKHVLSIQNLATSNQWMAGRYPAWTWRP
nr:MAG TPA: hypothetical protein [Caudoviricetes sp.]